MVCRLSPFRKRHSITSIVNESVEPVRARTRVVSASHPRSTQHNSYLRQNHSVRWFLSSFVTFFWKQTSRPGIQIHPELRATRDTNMGGRWPRYSRGGVLLVSRSISHEIYACGGRYVPIMISVSWFKMRTPYLKSCYFLSHASDRELVMLQGDMPRARYADRFTREAYQMRERLS